MMDRFIQKHVASEERNRNCVREYVLYPLLKTVSVAELPVKSSRLAIINFIDSGRWCCNETWYINL